MISDGSKGIDFNLAASNWDTPERSDRAKVVAEAIASELPLNRGLTKALEFGCGTGLVSFFLQDKLDHIDLVDTSEGMIQVLEKKLEEASITHLHPIVKDLMADSNSVPQYDVIYTSMVMHHIRPIEPLIHQFHKLLKPGGQLFLIDLEEEDGRFHADEPGFDGYNGFNQEFTKNLMANEGFEQNDYKTIFTGVKKRTVGTLNYALFMATGMKPEKE